MVRFKGFKILKELFSQGRVQQLFNFGRWRFPKSRDGAHFQKIVVNFYLCSGEFLSISRFRYFARDFL